MKTLVVGIGNPLRGDDGLGWQAVGAFAEAAGKGEVETLFCHGLVPELADVLARVDRVIFVDADASAATGSLGCRQLLAETAQQPFSHYQTPAALLALTQRLYGRRPEAQLLSLGAADFGAREGLSPQAAAALPLLVARLRALLGGGPCTK
jgi:hydrogenase maturation protease